MSSYRKYEEPDDRLESDGDQVFQGVNMRLDPGLLPPGMVSEAVNCRFNRGVVEPRRGIRKLPWTSMGVYDGSSISPLGAFHGAGEFSDPYSNIEWQLVAAGGKAYRLREGNAAVSIPLPEGVVLASPVSFTQCMNVVVLHRGESLASLVMDDLDEGFKVIAQSGSGSTEPIPNAVAGLFHDNRLWVPKGDLVSASDYLDYTRYAPATSQFYVESGDGDRLVGLYKFNDTTILAFKTRSVHVIGNLVADDQGNYSSAFQDRIINDYGCKARNSIVQVGSDVWFLSDQRGVVSIRQTETNKLQGVDVPVSEPITPLIQKIDWQHADEACAAFWDNKVYFAVPINSPRVYGEELIPSGGTSNVFMFYAVPVEYGATYFYEKGANEFRLSGGSVVLNVSGYFTAEGAEVIIMTNGPNLPLTCSVKRVQKGLNNAVLVYDTLNKAWSGYDEGDAVMVAGWVRFNYANRLRLGFLSYESFLNLYEDGFMDDIATVPVVEEPEPEPEPEPAPEAGLAYWEVLPIDGSEAQTVWSGGLTVVSGTQAIYQPNLKASSITFRHNLNQPEAKIKIKARACNGTGAEKQFELSCILYNKVYSPSGGLLHSAGYSDPALLILSAEGEVYPFVLYLATKGWNFTGTTEDGSWSIILTVPPNSYSGEIILDATVPVLPPEEFRVYLQEFNKLSLLNPAFFP